MMFTGSHGNEYMNVCSGHIPFILFVSCISLNNLIITVYNFSLYGMSQRTLHLSTFCVCLILLNCSDVSQRMNYQVIFTEKNITDGSWSLFIFALGVVGSNPTKQGSGKPVYSTLGIWVTDSRREVLGSAAADLKTIHTKSQFMTVPSFTTPLVLG